MPVAADAGADLDTLARQLAALGHGTRLRIYRILLRAGPQGLPVGQVQMRLGMAQSTLSFHLRKLVDVGLVRQIRDGTVLHCRCDMNAIGGVLGFLQEECCRDTRPGHK
jgi:DNA-binding transcriptional ArsR family regulator